MNAYGFDKNTLTLLFSYLKNRKQSVRIKTNYRSFLELLTGVPQGPILGTFLFRGCSYGGQLARLCGLTHLGEISPSLRSSYKNLMFS